MSIFDGSRLPAATFKLDYARMREGWYSDKYFTNVVRLLADLSAECYNFSGRFPTISPDLASEVNVGDLNVEIGAGRREATVAPILPIPLPSGRQAARIEASEREDIAEGALIIDVVNTATQALVWHGAARVVMEPSAIDDALLARATAAILSTFPGCTSSR